MAARKCILCGCLTNGTPSLNNPNVIYPLCAECKRSEDAQAERMLGYQVRAMNLASALVGSVRKRDSVCVAADLAATDPERFDEATGPVPTDPSITDPCPDCGRQMRHDGGETGAHRVLLDGMVCECGHDEREEVSRESFDYYQREASHKEGGGK